MTIPKILQQTIHSLSGIDSRITSNIDLLRNINKEWTYRLYEDKDCIKFINAFYGADFRRAFQKIDKEYGAAKADFFRYLLMYETGGVYLDIKSSCSVPLDAVLTDSDEFILSHWANGWGRHPAYGVETEYQQWHIVAKPRHPFLKAVIETVKRNIENYDWKNDGVGRLGVLNLTGPIAYTKAIRPILDKYPHRLVNICDLGFVYSVVIGKKGKSIHADVIKSAYKKSQRPIVKLAFHKRAELLFDRFYSASSTLIPPFIMILPH